MLELPEVITMAKQLDQFIIGKKIWQVNPPAKVHKFCWFSGDPAQYAAKMNGSAVQAATGFGNFVEINLDNGQRLCFSDGVNARLVNQAAAPQNYQLLVEFDDGTALVLTVAMYGGIILHDGIYDNEYYLKSKAAISPLADEFEPCYRQLLAAVKPTLSAKAFLATEQRFPGIGNGVLQDILFAAGIHPKRKIGTFSASEQDNLFAGMIAVLQDMIDRGGRDTEKDLWGREGGYRTKLSKNTLTGGCPKCGGQLVKEAYLGGAIYYCPSCQPLA